jgi:putative membrane protein
MFSKIAGAAVALVMMSATVSLAADLTDPQIAHVAYTAGQIDIDAAKLALQKATSSEVKAFANDMLRDHQSVNTQALALLKKLNVTPADNDTSKSLVTAAAAKTKELSALSGAAFDRAYIANEVAYHKTVNAALQGTLIPATKNGELKDLLSTGLKIFTGHQQHAEMLASSLK